MMNPRLGLSIHDLKAPRNCLLWHCHSLLELRLEMEWTVTVKDSGKASTALSKARLMWKIEGERLVFDA